MAIADKLTQIAENEINVYNSGKSKGYSDGFEEGKKAEYDAFWDAFQQNGNRTDYDFGFGGKGWIDETFKPKYPLKPSSSAYMFRGSTLAELPEIDFVTNNCFNFYGTFFNASNLKRVGDIYSIKAGNIGELFYGCQSLESTGVITVKEATSYGSSFYNCFNLANIIFDGVIGNDINFQWSTKLSGQSIKNIIEHLSDTASGKTLTLSKTAVDKAFEEGEGANNGSQTQEWEWYLGTKPNWTISLA